MGGERREEIRVRKKKKGKETKRSDAIVKNRLREDKRRCCMVSWRFKR